MPPIQAVMTVAGRSVPVGRIVATLSTNDDSSDPHSELDIVSDSDDESVGGLALNCIRLNGITEVQQLAGLAFALDQSDTKSELAESVFWTEGLETLEIESLSIEFGPMAGTTVPIKVEAECFDTEGPAGRVVLVAVVNVLRA